MKAVAFTAWVTLLGCSDRHARECRFLEPAVTAAEDAMRASETSKLSGITPSAYAAARSASAGRWLASFFVDEPDLEPLRDRLERAMQSRADAIEHDNADDLVRATERARETARVLHDACAR